MSLSHLIEDAEWSSFSPAVSEPDIDPESIGNEWVGYMVLFDEIAITWSI